MTDVDKAEFIARYGGIYEHSPWVAEAGYEFCHGKSSPATLAREFAACVDAAPHARKLELIRAHPDLAGRAAVAGALSDPSGGEQASAGLDACSPEEYARFTALNRKYRDRFGFPFVMAVRGSDRHEILAAFEKRLENDPGTEFETAIREIHRIARMRLEAL